MKSKLIYLALITVVIITGTSNASIFIDVNKKSFKPDTIFNDDVFIIGNNIKFQSHITGDLIGASQDIVFSGICNGNINWAARRITINGPVDGSIRGVAQTIDINSRVGRNLVAAGETITIGPGTSVSVDANLAGFKILAGSKIIFEGSVGNDLVIRGDKIIIAGKVGGDLDIKASIIEIEPSAVIEGDLIYKSPNKIKIGDEVVIKGNIRRIEIEEDSEQEKYSAFFPIRFLIIMFMIFNFIFSFIVFIVALALGNAWMVPLMFLALIVSGTVLVSINKKFALKATSVIENRFLVSLGLGILLILLFPLAALIAVVTFVGIPIGIMIVFAFGILSFVGVIYTAQFVGSYLSRLLKIGKQPPSFLCLFIGIIVLAGLILIPIIGWFVAIAALALGLGSIVLSFEKVKIDINTTSKPSST